MKKRIFSIILTVTMMVGLLPQIAVTANAASHQGDHGGISFSDATELTQSYLDTLEMSSGSYLLPSGTYFLTGNLKTNTSMDIDNGSNVTICLNGYTLSARYSAIRVFDGNLTLCDCTGNGKISSLQDGNEKSGNRTKVTDISIGELMLIGDGSVTLKNCDISTPINAGGINGTGTYTFENCTLDNFTVGTSSTYMSSCTVTLKDCDLSKLLVYNGTANVIGGTYETITTQAQTSIYGEEPEVVLTLDGDVTITWGLSKDDFGANNKIHLGADFSGKRDEEGAPICIGSRNAPFVDPGRFINSGITEQNVGDFAFGENSEKPINATGMELIDDTDTGTLSIRAYHAHGEGEDAVELTPWDGDTDISTGGSYFLAKPDKTTTDGGTVTISGDVDLCLAAMPTYSAITLSGEESDITIYDCGNYQWNNGFADTIQTDGCGSITLKSIGFDKASLYADSVHLSDVTGSILEIGSGTAITMDGDILLRGEDYNEDAVGLHMTDEDYSITLGSNFKGKSYSSSEAILTKLPAAPTIGVDVKFADVATGGDADSMAAMFQYYENPNNSIEVIAKENALYFHLKTLTINGEEKEAIDKDGDGICENESGYEVYIPADVEGGYIEITQSEDKYTKDETTGVYNDTDNVFEKESGIVYVPVDTNTPEDGIFDTGKMKIAIGDGTYAEDADGDGVYEDVSGKKYIPDQDGDNKAEPESTVTGVYDGTNNADGDENNANGPDNTYITDQDGDGNPEGDSNRDGVYEGTNAETEALYVIDSDLNDPFVKVEDEDGNGIYKSEDGKNYIPDCNDDRFAEKETETAGIYEDKAGNRYAPIDTDKNGAADKFVNPDDIADGVYTDPDTGTKYEDTDGDGIFTPKQTYFGGGGGGGGSSKPKPKVGLSNFKAINEYKNPFVDVKDDAWYYDSVKSAFEYDLVKGVAEGKYNPTGNVTIAEAITLVARIHSIYNTGKSDFTQGEIWYQVYVDYAIANGIIADGQFADFNKVATRDEFAEIFAKAIPETDFDAINNIEKGKIPDVAENDAVYLLYNAGILAGSDEAHSFKPESNIQRSEVATIVTRIVDKAKRVTFEI